jgi:hypothetical protein
LFGPEAKKLNGLKNCCGCSRRAVLCGFFGVFFGSAAGNSVGSVAATVAGAAAVDAAPVSVEPGTVAATAGGVAGFGATPVDGSERAVSVGVGVGAGAGAVAATGAGAAGFDAAFDGVSERAVSVAGAGLVTTIGGGDFGAARDACACERTVSLDFAAAAGVDDFVATLEGWSARTAGANAEPCTTAGAW